MEDVKLKVFMKLLETGSFTLSAKELGLSQPAVSQSISTLENSLGVTLFIRKRGRAVPTAEGLILKQYAEQILYWQSSAASMFGPLGKITMQRPVRIAADGPLVSYLLPKALAVVHKAQPKLNFDIIPVGWGDSDGCDVEITVSPAPKSIDFAMESMLLGCMDAALVVSPLNERLGAGSAYFSTISGIHVSNRFAVWSSYKEYLSPDLEARTMCEAASVESLKRLVAVSDDIVGIVPLLSVRDELSSGVLVRLPISLPDLAFDIHFNPAASFAQRSACAILRHALENQLKL